MIEEYYALVKYLFAFIWPVRKLVLKVTASFDYLKTTRIYTSSQKVLLMSWTCKAANFSFIEYVSFKWKRLFNKNLKKETFLIISPPTVNARYYFNHFSFNKNFLQLGLLKLNQSGDSKNRDRSTGYHFRGKCSPF